MNATRYASEIMRLLANFAGIASDCEDFILKCERYAFLMKAPIFIDFLTYCIEFGEDDFLENRKEILQETLDNLPDIPNSSRYMIDYH